MRRRGQKSFERPCDEPPAPPVGVSSASRRFRLVCGWAALVVGITLAAECFESTAYGKFGSELSLLSLPPRVGWWLMEPWSRGFEFDV